MIGDSVIVAEIHRLPKIRSKWLRLDTDAKRFVLEKARTSLCTEKEFLSIIKKARREIKKEKGSK